MPSSQEPLLQRPPSQNSSDTRTGLEEEDALLTGQRTGKQAPGTLTSSTRRWRELGIFAWALVATAAVVVLAVVLQHTSAQQGGRDDNNSGGHHSGSANITGKRNLIFMVSDGMGPTSLSLTRSWRQYVEDIPWDQPTLLLDHLLIGQSRTRSSSSLVTDSAAGATAFSCGHKSYNGAISVLPDYTPCGSVMEAAKRSGYTTGLVVTTRITDATPAVFVSHVRMRSMEDEIARQLVGETHPLGRMVDLVFGGGRCHFVGNGTEEEMGESCRADGVDVLRTAQEMGWDYISERKQFDGLSADAQLPLLGLFASRDIPYGIDRRFQEETYPSLEQMTRTALAILERATRDTPQGFFVMIEGSRIDHAGHANDPAAQVHEVQAYDHAVAVVMDFIRDSAVPTLMVATSDHETGGLAVARQLHAAYPEYLWHPAVLANATHSAAWTAHQYHLHLDKDATRTSASSSNTALKAYLTTLLATALGIRDPTTSELQLLLTDPDLAAYTLADMLSRRAQLGWSTHGHSAADVNIYTSNASLAGAALGGVHENIEVGAFLRDFLGVGEEGGRVTRALRGVGKGMGMGGDGVVVEADEEEAMRSFLGPVPASEMRLDGQDHFEHYAGDHRRRRAEGERQRRSGGGGHAREGCGCGV